MRWAPGSTALSAILDIHAPIAQELEQEYELLQSPCSRRDRPSVFDRAVLHARTKREAAVGGAATDHECSRGIEIVIARECDREAGHRLATPAHRRPRGVRADTNIEPLRRRS